MHESIANQCQKVLEQDGQHRYESNEWAEEYCGGEKVCRRQTLRTGSIESGCDSFWIYF